MKRSKTNFRKWMWWHLDHIEGLLRVKTDRDYDAE
jgi:hypothetical protein